MRWIRRGEDATLDGGRSNRPVGLRPVTEGPVPETEWGAGWQEPEGGRRGSRTGLSSSDGEAVVVCISRSEDAPERPDPERFTHSLTDERRRDGEEAQLVWRLRRLRQGGQPGFPQLRFDARQVAVGEEGLTSLPDHDTLLLLLGYLSRRGVFEASGLAVKRDLERGGDAYVIFFRPPERRDEPASAYFDGVDEALELVGARLYVGGRGAYVRYRDGDCPCGWDLVGPVLDGGDLVLFDHDHARVFRRSYLTATKLRDLFLSLAPLPDRRCKTPSCAVAVLPSPMLPIVLAYLQRHPLSVELARIAAPATGSDKGLDFPLHLLRMTSTREGKALPAFVLEWLASIPRVGVLAYQRDVDQGPRVLTALGHSYPIDVSNVQGIFPDDLLCLFFTQEYPNLFVHPHPSFVPLEGLADFEIQDGCHRDALEPRPLEPVAPESFAIEVGLRRREGPSPPPDARWLSKDELPWLQTLVYSLPEFVFHDVLVFVGDEDVVLHAQKGRFLEEIPFGLPMRSVNGTSLFVPVDRLLSPQLPVGTLERCFHLGPTTYSFLSTDRRIDLERRHFRPLGRYVITDARRCLVRMRVNPDRGGVDPRLLERMLLEESVGEEGGVLDRVASAFWGIWGREGGDEK